MLMERLGKIFCSLLIVAAPLCLPGIAAQTKPSAQTIDATIAEMIGKINGRGSMSMGGDEEVHHLDARLLAYVEKNVLPDARFLSTPLPNSENVGLKKVASKDGNVCFYSWDTWTGGTMHFYVDLVQWKGSSGVHWQKIHPLGNDGAGECGYFYHDVHSVRTADGKTIYMPTYRAIYSGPEHEDSVTAYEISGDKFIKVQAFQTPKKALDTIDVPASENAWDDNDLIYFEDNEQTLLIPITTKDRQVTGKFLSYRFNGTKYVFDPKAHEKPTAAQLAK